MLTKPAQDGKKATERKAFLFENLLVLTKQVFFVLFIYWNIERFLLKTHTYPTLTSLGLHSSREAHFAKAKTIKWWKTLLHFEKNVNISIIIETLFVLQTRIICVLEQNFVKALHRTRE